MSASGTSQNLVRPHRRDHATGRAPPYAYRSRLRQTKGGVELRGVNQGLGLPEASCGILGHPTKSLGLFRQMIGRLLRPHCESGKRDALILDHAGGVFAHGQPSDKIQWTLSVDARAENKEHAARGKEPDAPMLVVCPNCSAVRPEGRPCPECGWRPQPPAPAVVFADGELGEVVHSRQPPKRTEWTPAEQLIFYRMLLAIEAEHFYKPGWAAHKFRERFGSFPPWPWNRTETLPPSAAVSAWVRSHNIAYARSIGR
jgi:DNA repair protein RadD